MNTSVLVLAGLLASFPIMAGAQQPDGPAGAPRDAPAATAGVAPDQPMTASPYTAISGNERIVWIVDGTIGVRSLGIGVFVAGWQTAWNIPDEWGRTWSGTGKRYLAREADVAISNTIEAGLGALWGEDPRYIPAPRGSIRSRTAYALKTVVLAPRRDGQLAPAWGRYAGNTINNLIENTYLPPSYTTPGQTVFRSVSGLLSRAAYNLWEEFWPDVRRRLHR